MSKSWWQAEWVGGWWEVGGEGGWALTGRRLVLKLFQSSIVRHCQLLNNTKIPLFLVTRHRKS